ncbi:MAG: S8 family serine peptidase [bacterium]
MNTSSMPVDVPPMDSSEASGVIEPGDNPMRTVRIFVNFKQRPGFGEQALVRMAGGQIRHAYKYISTLSAEVPLAAIGQLKTLAVVDTIEYVPEVFAVDTELDNAWGVKRTGAGVVHPVNRGTGIRVAVIDTGIDATHPDLAANVKGGWDFVNNDNNAMDDHGHGTHVSGIIGAVDDNLGVVGMAPEASLYGLKVLDANGSGYADDVARALEWCITNQMQAVNMSLSGGSSSTLESVCAKAAQAGIILVAAAGNSGNSTGTGDSVGYPAKYGTVIAVAATDRNDLRASFSSTGPAVEIAAPGVSVYSTYPGGRYASMSGTSMACPHVAGTVALILGAGVPAANVRFVLQSTADDLGTAGRDEWYGYGLVDTDEAAQAAPPVTNNPPVVTIVSPDNNAQFDFGATISLEGSAVDTEDGVISGNLTWSSTLDGNLGTGSSFTRTLSEGTHTLTAQVTDSGGKTGSQTITVVVQAAPAVPNDPPEVTILSPTEGAVFDFGTAISFNGSAADLEDGEITNSLSWSSSLDGLLGMGGSFVKTLNSGIHRITAQVTDSGGNTGKQEFIVTVKPKPLIPTTLTVSTNKPAYANSETVTITITLVDENNKPVAGASVRSVITTAKLKKYTKSGTTNSNGRYSYTYRTSTKKDGSGQYKIDVTASKTGYEAGSGSTSFEVK